MQAPTVVKTWKVGAVFVIVTVVPLSWNAPVKLVVLLKDAVPLKVAVLE